jgi:hypothetical protein
MDLSEQDLPGIIAEAGKNHQHVESLLNPAWQINNDD